MENVKEKVDQVIGEVNDMVNEVKEGGSDMKKCINKKKWIKTAAIATGVAITAGVGYLVYQKYFRKAAVAAEVVSAAVEAATEM